METCFIIMPIGREEQDRKKWREVYETIFKSEIENSGLDLRCERADDIRESGSIMKQVLHKIQSSKIVLADLTTQNPNVFYELGVRHTIGKRSILVGQSPQDNPFDTQQYRMLVYKYPADPVDAFHSDIREFLRDSIRNPKKPDNPVFDLLPGPSGNTDRAAIRELLMELEDNEKTAEQFQIEHSYVPPQNAEWLKRRASLEGLPSDLQSELARVYEKIRLWKAIVDSGISPLTGSMKIPKLCQELRAQLLPLTEKLRQILKE